MSDKPVDQKVDYKSTLNLPDTPFAMQAKLATREVQWLADWQADDLYGIVRAARANKPKYILHDGPPYANGQIHLGHAVNKVLKDIILKSKTLSGFDAPYVPGWDCHGLPIEQKVEEKVGKVGVKVDATKFRELCREYAASQVELQKKDFERLGVLGDWHNPYLTMNFAQEANTVRALGKIVQAGHVQAGMKPVNWCLDCGSSLAEAEVEYQDKKSDAIDVGFSVVDLADLSKRINVEVKTPVDIVIWTTTPWTLPANQAVALNADLNYQLVIAQPQDVEVFTANQAVALILAENLTEEAIKRYQLVDHQVLATFKGAVLEHLSLQHPLIVDRQVPVILGEHVMDSSGTGAVHTAPGHGVDDYKVGLQYSLKVENPVSGSGVYLPEAAVFAGQHIYKANPLIIEQLKTDQKLWAHIPIIHSYPHCWRHKTPIIFRATPQWFISMEKQGLRTEALSAIKQVEWIPDWGQNRIESMIDGRPDWCISRQRTWGVPIPFFIHKDTGALYPDTENLIEKVATLIDQGGVDAWFKADAADLIGAGAAQYNKATDTLDVWFDSGVTHYCVLKQRDALAFPADLYLEGSDQHRGWFQTSLLTSLAIDNTAPFKKVLTHGFVVDVNGRKMSKSLGNIITPQEVIKDLGADGVRFWAASSDYRYEMTAGKEVFSRTTDGYRRIRNTLRFLLANLNGFNPVTDMVPVEQMIALDQFILNRAAAVQKTIQAAYDEMSFHQVCSQLVAFCTSDLGGFYLDIIKDRQYTTKADSVARRSAQTALYHLVHAFVRWMSPILTFTAQEAWQEIPKNSASPADQYVFTTEWYEIPVATQQTDASRISEAEWLTILHVKSAINKLIENARTSKIVGANLSAKVQIWAEAHIYEALAKLKDELRFVLIVSDVELNHNGIGEGEATELSGLHAYVTAADGIKCARCWHVRSDVGLTLHHPELCARCIENVDGSGEVRHYA
jgi:isoleucyl-tRNA synthetase